MTDLQGTQNLNNSIQQQKTRILWHSNAPWASTGYGNQTALIVPRLQKAGYEMGLSAFYGLEGGLIKWVDGIPGYPKMNDPRDPYGANSVGFYSDVFGADIAITLIDAWVLDSRLMSKKTKWVPYYPVDSSPLPISVFRSINTSFDRIAMSKFGQKMTNEAGLSCHYVPHAVDTKIYTPLDRNKCREMLSKQMGFDKDAFLIGMVAASKDFPSRKSFEPHLRAFAKLKEKHSDAQFYIHTDPNNPNGVNIPELIQFLGLTLGKDVFLPAPGGYFLGFGFEFMTMMYNAMDVHVLASMGEGFGIPIVEAQACGCPVIVGDWTSMSELCFSGWKIPESDSEKFYQRTGGYQYLPHSNAIYDAMEKAYGMRGNVDYRSQARDGALAYDIEKVVEKYWLPTLEVIKQRIEESK